MKININERVRVKLTPRGLALLKAERDKVLEFLRSVSGSPEILGSTFCADENGYYSETLWSIMHTFGSGMSMTLEPPFEACEIILCEHASPPE